MRLLLVALTLSGCAPSFEARGSHAVAPANAPPSGPAGTLGVGIALESETGSVAEYVEIGRGPLRAGAPAAIFGAGIRIDHAPSQRRPWLRGYGRLSLGTDEAGRGTPPALVSLALGVAVTHATDNRRATVGVGLVYTYAEDEMTGAGDFLGVELDAVLSVGRSTERQIGDWFEEHDK
jgi:hypothetical protein